MLSLVAEHPEVVSGVIAVLVALLGYFLVKVDKKVDRASDLVTQLSVSLPLAFANMRNDLKEDIVSAFNDTCSERQGACSKLQESKMQLLTATHTAICAKLARLDEERKEAWMQQRRWNDKIESNIYKDTGKPHK